MNRLKTQNTPITIKGLTLVFALVFSQGFVAAANLKNSQRAKIQTIDILRTESAIVTTKQKAEIVPRITGNIMQILFQVGQEVKAGDTLVLIESETADLQMQQAQAELSQAKKQVQMALQNLEAAKAGYEQADKHYIRIKKFLKTEAATPQQQEQAKTDYEKSKALLNSAHQSLDIARLDVTKAEKSVEKASTVISWCKLKAPFNGTITKRFKDPGDLALPGHPILQINDTSSFQMEAHINESLRNFLTQNQSLKVEINSLQIPGRIEEITPFVDPETGTFRIKVAFESNSQPFVGQYGKVLIKTGTRDVILIPKNYLVKVGQIAFVWILDQNTKQKQLLKIGEYQQNNLIEITAGLYGNETILDPKGI